MDDLEHLIRTLKALSSSEIRMVAEVSGVGFSSIQQIRYGQRRNPRYKTVRRLRDTLGLKTGAQA
jgi:hypothetical protein